MGMPELALTSLSFLLQWNLAFPLFWLNATFIPFFFFCFFFLAPLEIALGVVEPAKARYMDVIHDMD